MDIYKPQIFDFETEKQFLTQAQAYLVDKIIDTNAQEGAVRVGLSCGDSSLKLYQNLAKNVGVPWDQVFLYQIDEILAENSFQKQVKTAFGLDFCMELAEFNCFNLKYPADMIIKDYQDYLDNLDGVFFDITVLELRPDGSFAGLFPDGRHLTDVKQPILYAHTPDQYHEKARVTLNIESILNSDEIIVLNYGQKNRANLIELMEGQKPASQFPAKMLLAHPKLKIFQFV